MAEQQNTPQPRPGVLPREQLVEQHERLAQRFRAEAEKLLRETLEPAQRAVDAITDGPPWTPEQHALFDRLAEAANEAAILRAKYERAELLARYARAGIDPPRDVVDGTRWNTPLCSGVL